MTTSASDEARSALSEAVELSRQAAGAQRESEEAQKQAEYSHREAQSAHHINELSLRAGQGAISTLIAAAGDSPKPSLLKQQTLTAGPHTP